MIKKEFEAMTKAQLVDECVDLQEQIEKYERFGRESCDLLMKAVNEIYGKEMWWRMIDRETGKPKSYEVGQELGGGTFMTHDHWSALDAMAKQISFLVEKDYIKPLNEEQAA